MPARVSELGRGYHLFKGVYKMGKGHREVDSRLAFHFPAGALRRGRWSKIFL